MSTEIQKVREAVEGQLERTDEVIASNEAITELISQANSTLEAGFSGLAYGLQEMCFAIDDGFREVSYKLDLQNETLKAIKEILERPLDTQAKELRKRAEFAYLNGWMDEAENDLLESEKKNYQDFIALHILGNIYYHHKKNQQKALEYFQKAAKYAAPQSKIDACKALICAAKVYKEIGRVEDAYKSTRMAMELPSSKDSSSAKSPLSEKIKMHLRQGNKINAIKVYREETGVGLKEAKDFIEAIKEGCYVTDKPVIDEPSQNPQVLFNHAAYAAMTRHIDESIDYLKMAVLTDPTCLIAADNDERFYNVKQEKEALKREIRDAQRKAVDHLRQQIISLQKDFKSAKKVAEETGITDFTSLTNDLAALNKRLAEIDNLCSKNGYFDLLKAEKIANALYTDGLEAYEENIDEWVEVKNDSLGLLRAKENKISGAGWGWCAGILMAILLSNSKWGWEHPVLGLLLMVGVGFLTAYSIKLLKVNSIREEIEKLNNDITRLSNMEK